MLHAVHAEAVVDLVREDHELVLAGDADDSLEDLARVHGTGRVVRVDDDDGLGPRRDLGADVIEVGSPVRLLVADVVHDRAAGERGAGGPQGVVGARDEDLVAVVEQGAHAEVDELRDAVARVDVVHADVGDALDLVVLHDGLARREEALARRVALAVGELVAHVVDDLVGRAEPEGCGVADVELEDVRAVLLHAVGLVDDGAAHVVEDVVELGGLVEGAHGGASLASWFRGHGRWRVLGSRPGEPILRDAQSRGEKRHDARTRHGLSAQVLAHLTLAELYSLLGGHANEVDLLEAALAHRLSQPGCKARLGHLTP